MRVEFFSFDGITAQISTIVAELLRQNSMVEISKVPGVVNGIQPEFY